jgi:hypothetical protein
MSERVADRDAVRQAVIEKAKYFSVKTISVTDDTEIYYDLRISGDDFDELICWMHQTYGTDFSEMKRRYVPGEVEIYPLITRLFGAHPYASITIGDLVDAACEGKWKDRIPKKRSLRG